jgi:carboxyl-terminal processing protease
MGNGRSCGLFGVVFWMLAFSAGCSSSGGGDSRDYDTYTTSGSDLVLKISNSLNVSQEEIERIHYYADLVDHCHTTSRDTVDIALAEACVYYDTYYLYPDFFPENLDSILDVSAYVDYLGYYDPYTFYFSPTDFEQVMAFYEGNSAFIGLSVNCAGTTVTDETPLYIRDIELYTRAWIDGFEVGDHIIEIDGRSIAGMTPDAAYDLLPTTEAETVEITVSRDGAWISIWTAAEENISLLLYDDIAYLNARSFTEATGRELRLDFEALQAAAGSTIDKLILDLRGNGGGAHSGTVELIDYLIDMDSGVYPIMTRFGPAVEEETEYLGDYNTANIGIFDETNFVLLIDDDSASASEIVAAALKYYDTAYLMGETTHGKGIGQYIIDLVDGSGVVVPAIENLPPSGISYHGIGIVPDVYVNTWAGSFDDDDALDAAVEYLTTGSVRAALKDRMAVEKRASDSEPDIDPLYRQLVKKNRSGNYF